MTLSPFFPWYLAHATVTECSLIDVPLNAEDGFVLTEDMLEQAYVKSEKRVKDFRALFATQSNRPRVERRRTEDYCQVL